MRFPRTLTGLGWPHHGLAVNGVLTTPGGDKAVAAMVTAGACKLVRHPSAPGAQRNAAQLAHDTARGHAWRDYALLTGAAHNINGTPAALGGDRWLYCDPGGNTWVVGVTLTKNTADITIELRLEALFGRLGRAYTLTPSVLATLVWSPPIPSWYTGGFTAADVVPYVTLRPESLVFTPDGSACYVHLYVDQVGSSETLCRDLYPETQPNLVEAQSLGSPLVSILRASVSGTGDRHNDGTGVLGTLIEHYEYEADIVLLRAQYANESQGVFGGITAVVPDASPAAPANGSPPTLTATWSKGYTVQSSGDASGYEARTGYEYTAVLYLTFDGAVTRRYLSQTRQDWTRAHFNDALDVYDLTNVAGGTLVLSYGTGVPDWYLVSCSETGHVWTETHIIPTEDVLVEYDILGTQYAYHYQKTNDQFDAEQPSQGYPATPEQNYVCGGRPSLGIPPSQTVTRTLNGSPISGDGWIYHDLRILAPNLFYVAMDYPKATAGQSTMDERVVALNALGVAAEVFDQQTDHAPLAGSRKLPDLRELVWSYQPVTEESAHAPLTLFQAYSGDLYQYV